MNAGSPSDDSGDPAQPTQPAPAQPTQPAQPQSEPGGFASSAPAAWSAPAEWTAPSWSAPDNPAPQQPAGNGFGPANSEPWPPQPTAEPPGGQYGPPPGGQYGYPSSAYYNPVARRTNPAAIAALVCGIVQFPLGVFLLNILLAIPAIICGAIGLRQTQQRGQDGRGMAIAGLVLGILGVVYFAIVVVLGFVFLHLAHPITPPAGP